MEWGSRVTLCHVIQRVPGLAPGELEAFYRKLVARSERQLRQAARRFTNRAIEARTAGRVGEPATEFVGATMRDVAARAGVDAALVHHYFGTKQQLFVAAMELPIDFAVVAPALLQGPPDGVGERFVRFALGLWDRPEVRPLLLGMVRSATTDPVARSMLRRLLEEGPLLALATALDRPDARLRATSPGAADQLAMARLVVGVELS
jgi:AcrR family transcriptional regulator